MRIIVLGAGLAGVSTAWYLRAAGHEVTVVDRCDGPAMETSFANGGQISVSHPEPWSNPRTPGLVMKWLGKSDAPLLFRFRADRRQWMWGMAFLRECSPWRSHTNTLHIARLAKFSRDELVKLRQQLNLQYDQQTRGILHTFFTEQDYAQAEPHANLLAELGIRSEVATAEQCRQIEPALHGSRATLMGGLFAPEDETGDAHLFTQQLATACAEAGVTFRYGTQIDRFDARQGRLLGVSITDASGTRGALVADAYVVTLGSYSRALVRPLGERLPIYPVKGYSVTLPAGAGAPRVSITDESRRIVVSRMGDRVRIAGTAELNGYDLSIPRERTMPLLNRALELFPELGEVALAQSWAGLRPMTPSNVPIIGAGHLQGLYYNTGHGSLGWTMACGSARVLADVMTHGKSPIDIPLWRK